MPGHEQSGRAGHLRLHLHEADGDREARRGLHLQGRRARLLPQVQYSPLDGYVAVQSIEVCEVSRTLQLPGSSDKRLKGNGKKLTYSCAVGCNWLCLAGV